jgi:lipoprotein-anchoring transpeptidase ErfK/SrfK
MCLTGCATNRESATGPFFPTRTLTESSGEYGDEISYWAGAGLSGKPRIVIDLEQQRAYFYKGRKIVGISIVSTGREGYDTPSGEFRITQKDLTHVSSIYGDYVDRSGQVVMENVDVTTDLRPRGAVFRGAPMPYFLRIQGGIGMHAGYLPGYPASHGCIRLAKEMAVHFFQNAPVGTHVAIRQESPQDYAPSPLASDRYLPLTSIIER